MIEDDSGKYHDEPVGRIASFDMRQFAHFDVAMNEDVLGIKVNDLDISKKITELPYVFAAGRIIFIAGFCRIGIRNIEVEEL